MTQINDIVISRSRRESPEEESQDWKTLDSTSEWWYVSDDPDYNKEGVYIHFDTKNNSFGVSISTEELIKMLRVVTERVTGSNSISIAFAEAG